MICSTHGRFVFLCPLKEVPTSLLMMLCQFPDAVLTSLITLTQQLLSFTYMVDRDPGHGEADTQVSIHVSFHKVSQVQNCLHLTLTLGVCSLALHLGSLQIGSTQQSILLPYQTGVNSAV